MIGKRVLLGTLLLVTIGFSQPNASAPRYIAVKEIGAERQP